MAFKMAGNAGWTRETGTTIINTGSLVLVWDMTADPGQTAYTRLTVSIYPVCSVMGVEMVNR